MSGNRTCAINRRRNKDEFYFERRVGRIIGFGQKVFGKPVNANQGFQWYLADMATKTEAAKALTLNAAALRQAGKNITKEAAMAKYYASETAVEVANKALQIHGGYGYMKEYAIERQYRDARIIPIYEGTSEVQKMVISRAVINGK